MALQGSSRTSLAALRDALAAATADTPGGDLQGLSDDLFAVVSLLASQGSLRRMLSDPSVDRARKSALVDRLLADRVRPQAVAVVRHAAQERWSEPVDLVDALEVLAVEVALARADRDGNLDEVEDELFRFQRIVAREPELRQALTSRLLPPERKRQLVARLLEDRVAPVTLALVERAVLAPRGRTIERVLDAFSELAAGRRERLLARVTSAIALDDDQQRRLVEALHASFGRDVRLQIVVDPSLVGGLTVRIGDELIDGSVTRQLAEARRRLTGGSGSRF